MKQRRLKSIVPKGIRQRLAGITAPRPGEDVDQLGVPIRLHYAFMSISSLVMSSIPLALSFTPKGEQLSSPVVRAICLFGIFLVWGYWAYGKRNGFKRDVRFYHFAAFVSIAMVGVCSAYVGELRGPLAAVPLAGPMIIGYFLAFRESFVHIVYAVAIAIAVGPHLGEPDWLTRTTVLVIVMLTGWLVITSTKNRLIEVLAEHRELSETDPLTGASNVRRLESLLNQEVERSNRGGDGFSIVEFDLDEFKQTNDRYSHTIGDQALLATANAVRSELSPADVLVRRGGDEFTVVVPHTSSHDLDNLCDRIGLSIELARADLCPDIKSTASIGWTAHRQGETAQELVMRADDVVKSAKAVSRLAGEAPQREISGSSSPVREHAGHLTLVSGSSPDSNAQASYVPRSAPTDPIAAVTAFAWKQAAALFIVVDLALVVLVATGRTSIEANSMFFGLSAAGFCLAGLCWWISTHERTPRAVTHLLAIGTLVVITSTSIGRGTAATATIELYLVAIVFQMYLLPTRTAIAYATVTMGLYAAVLAVAGYADAGIRVNSAVNTILLVSIVLAVSRRRTIELAVENADLARTDALTGLANVRSLRIRMDEEIARSSATGEKLSLIMLDLDDFKRVNDVHGHSRGDNVLAGVADALRKTVRRAELPARRGGDEFAILLTDSSGHEAEMAVNRFGGAIESVRAALCDDVTPTASIGYATWQIDDSTDDLLEKADAALHDAKMRSHEARGPARSRMRVSRA